MSDARKSKESIEYDDYEAINSEDEWDPDNRSMYDYEEEGTEINNPQGNDLSSKHQDEWSQEIQDITAKQGLSPRGRK